MFFSERLRAQSVIFTFTFVLLINFNNCGEGFQAVDGGNDQGAGSEIKKTPTGKISQDIEFLNISKNRISFASNFTFGKKNPPVKLEDDLYAITAYNFTDNIMKESLIYGSFNDLISNNYSELTKPDLSEYLNEFDIINEKYYFSNHGNRYDDSLVKHIYYNAQLSLKSDSATELNLHFVYTKNNSLSFFPLLFFKSDDRENNTINTKTKISKSWFYYTTNNQELYIHNNQTDERINVQSTPIISPDEVWLINPKQDGLCHAINIQTKSSFALGPPIDILKPNCKSYSFLTSNIIVENFYNNGLFYESENYERNDNNILRDIKIINLDNKRTTTLSNKYFSFDFQKQVITYLDDSNFINKQLLDDFLEGKKPLISFRRLNFSSMTKNYDTDIWLKSFNSFFAILSKKSNQAPLLINNLTQHVHNLSDHISLMNKSKYFGQSWSPDGNPLTIHKFGSDYYATVNKSDFFKINFSTEKPNEIDLPIYNCATSETPKTKLSETCIWNLVTLGKPYKNFFKFNVRFPLKTESLNVKERWIYLPPGTSIDNSDENNWVFPQGTIFFKNFAYTNSSGTNHVLKNLETRVIEKISNNEGPGAWRPSVYVWNNQQTEATYTEGGLDIELNHNGNIYTYKVPSKANCLDCHRGNNDMVAGFKHLQLSFGYGDFDNIQEYYKKGLLKQKPTDFNNIPALETDGIQSNEQLWSIQTIGLLNTNCSGCHSPKGIASYVGLDFTYTLGTTDHKLTNAYLSAVASGKAIPGDHANSVMYQRVRDGVMPRGTVLPYTELANYIKNWIDLIPASEEQ